jgi:hypothetical protein
MPENLFSLDGILHVLDLQTSPPPRHGEPVLGRGDGEQAGPDEAEAPSLGHHHTSRQTGSNTITDLLVLSGYNTAQVLQHKELLQEMKAASRVLDTAVTKWRRPSRSGREM